MGRNAKVVSSIAKNKNYSGKKNLCNTVNVFATVFLMFDFLSNMLFLLNAFAGLEFFETSAKENINVKAVFEKLVEIICNKMAESLDSENAQPQPKGQRLDNASMQKPSTQQCNC